MRLSRHHVLLDTRSNETIRQRPVVHIGIDPYPAAARQIDLDDRNRSEDGLCAIRSVGFLDHR